MKIIIYILAVLYLLGVLVATFSYNYLRFEGKFWKSLYCTSLIFIPMGVLVIPIVVGILLGQKMFGIVSEDDEENNQ